MCEYECEVQRRQNESLRECEWFVGLEIPSYMHGHRRVAHALRRGKVHWSPNVIRIRCHIPITLSGIIA